MWLLLTYVGLVLIGYAIIYFLGLLVEQVLPVASLPMFLLMFFMVMWLSWLAAVKLTAPKVAAQA